ncbi:MAG TPA: hypothetical protein VMV77_01740 [Bacteroidales bacterium]|nr:hypothetical protein [Bacteroidales bacterium]
MIIGKETDTVYLSRLLQTDSRFSDVCNRLTHLLENHAIKYYFLDSTKDIWCRDYMPIQIEKDGFVQFRYEPFYLKDYLDLQTDPRVVVKENRFNFYHKYSKINLDDGNIVSWKNKVIITDRVFDENPIYSSKHKLVSDIEELLEALQ